jgi:hypothetical protein
MVKLNSEMKAGTDADTVTDVQVNHVSQTIAKPNVMGSFYDYDSRGVRAFVGYSTGTGKWKIECYRKKTVKELEDEFIRLQIPIDSNWQFKREGHIMSYDTRQEAEQKALELAEEICKDYGL